MLLGIATLIEKFSIHPVDGVTVLSQVTTASLGDGFGFYVVQFSTVVLLALAANTSFGGLPVLAQLLAKHNNLPHVFALRAERQVYRYGVGFLAITSALLLIVSDGDMNTLVPLFAIGVFVGFTLSQSGMVRHWRRERPRGWPGKAALNGFGALLTGVAAVVVTATKFGEGGWLIVVALPALVAVMEWVHRSYRGSGNASNSAGRRRRPGRTGRWWWSRCTRSPGSAGTRWPRRCRWATASKPCTSRIPRTGGRTPSSSRRGSGGTRTCRWCS